MLNKPLIENYEFKYNNPYNSNLDIKDKVSLILLGIIFLTLFGSCFSYACYSFLTFIDNKFLSINKDIILIISLSFPILIFIIIILLDIIKSIYRLYNYYKPEYLLIKLRNKSNPIIFNNLNINDILQNLDINILNELKIILESYGEPNKSKDWLIFTLINTPLLILLKFKIDINTLILFFYIPINLLMLLDKNLSDNYNMKKYEYYKELLTKINLILFNNKKEPII